MDAKVKTRFISVIGSLLITSIIYVLLILKYFTYVPLLTGRMTVDLMPISNMFLVISLIALVLKDLIAKNTIFREHVMVLLLISASIYSFLGSLIDISRLMPNNFIYIPPAFIIIECHLEDLCRSFKSLTISIPLGIAFTILIYSLNEVIKTYRTIRIENISKIVDRPNSQDVHDANGYRSDS